MTQPDEREGPADRRQQPPGNRPVGTLGIVLSVAYLGGLTAGLMYMLLALWPQPSPKFAGASDSTAVKAYWACDSTMVDRWRADSTVADPKCASVAGANFLLWDEQRLLLIVMLAGALGALLHALRSLSMYIGNRKYKRSWLVMYILLPFTGGLIALVFYVVIRAGFFAPGTSAPTTTPYAFAAMAFLVGLFSQVAIEKLKIVAESFFTKAQPASDSLSGKDEAVIRRAERVASKEGGPKDAIDIDGIGFTEDTRLEVNGRERTPELQAPTKLRLMMDDWDRAVFDNGGELSVRVKNEDKSPESAVTVS